MTARASLGPVLRVSRQNLLSGVDINSKLHWVFSIVFSDWYNRSVTT